MTVSDLEFMSLPNSVYDCMISQLVYICKYYRKQHYKMFFHPLKFKINNCSESNLEDQFIVKNNWFENLAKYYYIEIKKEIDISMIPETDFTDKLFLVNYRISKYPPCSNVESFSYDSHMCILYDFIDDNCIIFDGFYGLRNFAIEYIQFTEGIKKVWELSINTPNACSIDELLKEYLRLCMEDNFYDIINEYHMHVIDLKTMSYNKDVFFDKLSNIYRRTRYICDFICGAVTEREHEDLTFIELCTTQLTKLSEEIRKYYFILVKCHVKKNGFSQDDYLNYLNNIKPILLDEKILIKNIYNIVYQNDNSLVMLLKNQLEKYLGHAVCLDDSAYDIHDGMSIAKLIIFFENENDIELYITDYTGSVTYRDFLKCIFRKILCKKIMYKD